MPPVRTVRVPDEVAATASEVWGDAGRRWVQSLPDLVAALGTDWGLSVGEPFPGLSVHWVAPARCADGTDAVLKLGPPGPGHLAVEAEVLGRYDGHGAARLLRYDADRGALLLERAVPGTRASALVPHDDEAATAAVITVARQLHAAPLPSPHAGVPDLLSQCDDLDAYLRAHGVSGPLPRRLVEQARSLFRDLAASADAPVLLHGDLHHDNVLRADGSNGSDGPDRHARAGGKAAADRTWLAIDPHGVVGDRAYEAGAMLYNPEIARREPALAALVPARVEQLADGLQLPVERVRAWGFVKAVVSEVWSCEDGVPRHTRALDVAFALQGHGGLR